jgi:hypothetical protein
MRAKIKTNSIQFKLIDLGEIQIKIRKKTAADKKQLLFF